MSAFLDPLVVLEVDDAMFQVYDHPFRYQSDIAGLITVPVGFITDFASVPRIGWIFALLGDIAHQPALIHDWLYFSALTTRHVADDVLLEAMAVSNISLLKRQAIYHGVRFGGWQAWHGHRMAGDPNGGIKSYV